MGFGFRSKKGNGMSGGSLIEQSKKSSSSVFKKTGNSQDVNFTNVVQQVMCELTLFSDVSYMKDILEVDSFQKEVQSLGEACVGSMQRGPDGEPSYIEALLSSRSGESSVNQDDESQ